MNRLSPEKRCRVVAALVEGNSIRSTVRMTGVAKNTVTKLLCDLGAACEAFSDRALRDLPCSLVQCDEIWAFVYGKQKNLPPEKRVYGFGDVYTWTAIDADTKLVPCWLVGQRDAPHAYMFVRDLASRLRNRIQLSTDGLHVYLKAVDSAFEGEIDYAQVHKIYGPGGDRPTEAKYSPPKCVGTKAWRVCGHPDEAEISTSYVERHNLTIRMGMRRFTRLTNGFSKKIENHAYAVALGLTHYNFCRPHGTLNVKNGPRVTPAMAAGVADHVWTREELVGILERQEACAA